MRQLKPLHLHEFIQGETVWTDDLWSRALEYLLANTATPDAQAMYDVLYPGGRRPLIHKIDYLREFRAWPPTVLLGTYDLMRLRKRMAADLQATSRFKQGSLREPFWSAFRPD